MQLTEIRLRQLVTVCAVTVLLGASRVDAANLRLNWQNTSTNHLGITIERQNGTTYVQIASLAPTAQSFSDSGLNDGTTYCYRVRAFNSAGPSAYSNSACASTAAAAVTTTTTSSGTTSTGSTGSPGITSLTPSTSFAAAGIWTDYRLSLYMLSRDSGAIGVVFRYQDPDNYYRFSWCGAAQCRRLEKQVNGVFTTLAQDSGRYTTGQNYSLDVIAQGTKLQVLINGVSVFSVTDTAFSAGTVGLYSNNNAGSSFDTVKVTDLNSGKTLLLDDFNDANSRGWTPLDEGASNGSSNWSATNGYMSQSSKIGSSDASALGTTALYTARPWGDYRTVFKMKSDDDDRLGIMFRYQDGDNFYRFVWNQGTPGRRLMKKENGVYTLLAEDIVPYVTGQTYQIEIIAQGSSLKVNVNGQAVFAVNDASFASGTIALYSSFNQGSYFDDILVEDLTAAKTVLLAANFGTTTLAGWTAIDDRGTTLGPSVWTIANGALAQTSNIGSDATGHPGTFLLY